MCFSPYWGVWRVGGGSKGAVAHNLFMHLSTLCSSTMKISEIDCFDILAIHNDQISYLKHVLDPLYVFFTLSGSVDGGGVLPNDFVTIWLIC